MLSYVCTATDGFHAITQSLLLSYIIADDE